jgi:hypothetical protein
MISWMYKLKLLIICICTYIYLTPIYIEFIIARKLSNVAFLIHTSHVPRKTIKEGIPGTISRKYTSAYRPVKGKPWRCRRANWTKRIMQHRGYGARAHRKCRRDAFQQMKGSQILAYYSVNVHKEQDGQNIKQKTSTESRV